MKTIGQGQIRKLKASLIKPIAYQLPLASETTDKETQYIPLNPLIGQSIKLTFTGAIFCCHCQRKTTKSFNQGYCFPCFKKLARCDICIIQPERCHYHQGTCREPKWGESHCMQDHIIYLANTSDLKVGITRNNQIPTRWIDQGATQALPIMRVATRYQSGLAEVIFKAHVKDKTNWRTMLKESSPSIDLSIERDKLVNLCKTEIDNLQQQFGIQSVTILSQETPVTIIYPIKEYLNKITSFNFDKEPTVEGTLLGIKGQYLIMDTGVINMRKFTSYNIIIYTNE